MQTLTQSERTRLYCVFKACPTCGAHRGELCRVGRGKVWRNGYHWMRGPFSNRCGGIGLESRRAYRVRYEKLKKQILDQREILGHE